MVETLETAERKTQAENTEPDTEIKTTSQTDQESISNNTIETQSEEASPSMNSVFEN